MIFAARKGFLLDDLRTVLDFFGVRLDVVYVGNMFFEVTLQLRCGTIHKVYLDLASLLVRRSLLNVLSSIMTPVLYQAFSSLLNHRFISSSQEMRVSRHSADNVTPPYISSSKFGASESSSSKTRQNRVIPLPYITGRERAKHPKRRHTTVASLLGEPEYTVCKHCFKSFNRRSNMFRHIDRTHCERVVFNCPQCPAVYKHAFHFADHLRGHEEDPQFACESCEKKFMSRNELRNHKRRNCMEPPPKKRPSACRRSRQYEPQPDAPLPSEVLSVITSSFILQQ
ncbi:hypothetical protein Y032_0010g1169 [Ancylostoma ceylanicum]|uniref:C2H2-type domain-containing protein n=1 Tax=Ancylostoma ceylanicum TaxID=53326 RepID=A0A016VFQ0_9BILA|nr:hypothetical protein Y032_0010g1169 [Ancylostoma ceylanicum]